MSSKLFVTILLAASGFGTLACTRNVTNNSPAPANFSNPQRASEQQSDSNSGGVINGGGGKGVLCNKNGVKTVEVLDLYEAKRLYRLNTIDVGSSEDSARDKLAELFAKHLWNPFTIPMEQYKETIKTSMFDEFFNNMQFIDEGQRLKATNDSLEPMIEAGCEIVQIANYYDESILLVDRDYWNQMNWTNKMALLAHEAFYFIARQAGTTNSVSVRKLVGRMFSTEGLRPLADGVPVSRDNFAVCSVKIENRDRGTFFLFPKTNSEGRPGLETVFTSLKGEMPLFRTSALFEGITIQQLKARPHSRETELLRDTYPSREVAHLTLGPKEGNERVLEGQLSIWMNTGSNSQTMDVSCYLPDGLEAQSGLSTEPGVYLRDAGGGPNGVVTVTRNGVITLEDTHQVGGPGGFVPGAVPYPTSCRIKETGFVLEQDAAEIKWSLTKVELVDSPGNTEHCEAYIRAANAAISEREVQFTLRKSMYRKSN